MFSTGPSCQGKVAISLAFTFAFQPGRKIHGQIHGKNQEGKHQTMQTIGRKKSDFPDHKNRKWLHYFSNFGKQNWYCEYSPCLALFRLFMISRLWRPEATAPLPGHTQVAKWLQEQDCYGKELKIELIRAASVLKKNNSRLQRNFFLFIMFLCKKLSPIYPQYCAMSMIFAKSTV